VNRRPAARRYWNSLVGIWPSAPLGSERVRNGYTFWERYWASLTVNDLEPRSTRATGDARPAVSAAPRGIDFTIGTAQLMKGGWFPLPPIPAASGLRAGDDNDVLAAGASPEGIEFFVRLAPSGSAVYEVEVVVRRELESPALVGIRYATATGQRFLLVPIADMRFGTAIAQVNLPGLESGGAWEASGPRPAADAAEWTADADVIAASIQAAASTGTRAAWRTVRDTARGGLPAVIDRFLR